MLGSDHIEALALAPLFEGLEPSELARIADNVMEQEYGAGREIVVQGHDAAAFYLIVSGTAVVLVDGVERRVLGPGEYFGELSVLDTQPRTASVIAGEPPRALVITAWDFRPLLSENWPIAET